MSSLVFGPGRKFKLPFSPQNTQFPCPTTFFSVGDVGAYLWVFPCISQDNLEDIYQGPNIKKSFEPHSGEGLTNFSSEGLPSKY